MTQLPNLISSGPDGLDVAPRGDPVTESMMNRYGGCEWLVDERDGTVYRNTGLVFRREWLRPYHGPIQDGKAIGNWRSVKYTYGTDPEPPVIPLQPVPNQIIGAMDVQPVKISFEVPAAPEAPSSESTVGFVAPVQEFSHDSPEAMALPDDQKPLEGGKFIQVGLADSVQTKDFVKGSGS